MTAYPQIFRVRQQFDGTHVSDVPGEVAAQLARLQWPKRLRPGQSVAVTGGSRGIANIAEILRAAVEYIRSLGGVPFVVPAMGSHGGGTAEGQLEVLASYGVTPEYLGCPIRASMETVIVCRTAQGVPVHFDRMAHQAEHVLVVNRVKPHTDFSGRLQSGLMKMLLIGLGKHNGANAYHRAFADYSFESIVESVAAEVLSRCRIAGGLAIVENAYDQTALLEAVPPERFAEREPELLAIAQKWMPRLPFRNVDVLIVDEIGKNFSGTGMDTNVIGRKFNDHEAAAHEWPKVKRIIVRGLTPQTHGNASGIGIAEFCPARLLQQVDIAKTRMNCLTSGHVSAAMLPLDYPSDRAVLDAALPTVGMVEPPDARLLWIANTLHLAEVECSAAYRTEAESRGDLEILTPLREMPFDAAGDLPANGMQALSDARG